MFFISTVTSTNVNFNFSKSFRGLHFVIDSEITDYLMEWKLSKEEHHYHDHDGHYQHHFMLA